MRNQVQELISRDAEPSALLFRMTRRETARGLIIVPGHQVRGHENGNANTSHGD